MTNAQLESPDTEPYDTPSAEDLATIRPPRRQPRWLLPAGVLCAALLAVGAVVSLSSTDAGTWQTQPVVRGTLAQQVTAVGQLEPVVLVEVGSDLTGRLATVQVEKNTRVVEGQALAQLDPGPFEHALARARSQVSAASAALAKARAEREDAVSERDRTQRLVERQAQSRNELESAELQLQLAQTSVRSALAALEQAEATLADAETDLADTTIRSPIDGVVIQRYVDPGQTVVSSMSATTLFEVASDLSALEVEVGVDEADVARVHTGQEATFTVSAFADQAFRATVVGVDLAPDPDESVVVYNTNLRVDNTDGLLRPGMTATATILVAELPDVLQVPTLALGYRPSRDPFTKVESGDVVYVLRDGTPVATPAKILGSSGSQTAVQPLEPGALAEGDLVVLGGGR